MAEQLKRKRISRACLEARWPSLAERLFSNAIPEPNSGCLLWCGAVDSKGYGRIVDAGQELRAHRVAWEQVNGPIPDGLHVCHKCDVRSCINTDHMFLGTHAENMDDRDRKGHSPKGARNGSAKLIELQVHAILADPRTQRAIAADFGISKTQVGYIKSGRSWAHVA